MSALTDREQGVVHALASAALERGEAVPELLTEVTVEVVSAWLQVRGPGIIEKAQAAEDG